MRKTNDIGGNKKTIKLKDLVNNNKQYKNVLVIKKTITELKNKNIDIKPLKKLKKQHVKNYFFRYFFTCLFGILILISYNVFAKKDFFISTTKQVKYDFNSGVESIKVHDFSSAKEFFENIESSIKDIHRAIRPILNSAKLTSNGLQSNLNDIFQLTYKGIDLMNNFLNFINEINLIKDNFNFEENNFNQESFVLISELKSQLLEIQKIFNKISNSKIPFLLPKNIKEKLIFLKEKSLIVSHKMQETISILDAFEIVLGKKHPQTIAIFFQNTGEIRPTGGFPGSLAIFEINYGKIKFNFYDIYYFAWKNGNFLPPPLGYERIAKRLNLRDSNNYFDFTKSANQMRLMLEKSKGPTAETIITISDKMFAELVDILGEIKIPNTEIILTKENASLFLSFFVEGKHFGKHTPKNAISSLLPNIQNKINNIDNKILYNFLIKAIENKWILASSNNEEIQKAFEILKIDGNIKKNNTRDYLAVVSSNVGGNKSDRFIKESIKLDTFISTKKIITNSLKITRYHTWSNKEEEIFSKLIEKYKSPHTPELILKDILGAGGNHSFTKVYVPLGSKLITSKNIPIEKIKTFEESGKTVFAFRFPEVEKNTDKTVYLTYELPTKNNDLSFYFQTQPGRDSVLFEKNLYNEQGIKIKGNGFFNATISKDLFITDLFIDD